MILDIWLLKRPRTWGHVTVRNVLFLCTGNSARSILGEVLMNDLGRGRFRAYSAGSHPTGTVNPGAIEKLMREGHSVEGLQSESWDNYTGENAPAFDLVITVCDNAAGEACPVWNGAPVRLHWGLPDPAAFDDEDERRKAFDSVYDDLRQRITSFLQSSAA